MNPFTLTMAIGCVGASIYEFKRGNIQMGIVYAAWAVSNAALARI